MKAGSSAALVAAAWLFVVASRPATRPIARLIAVGMTLGSIGDASPLLGRLWPDPQRTLVNMLLFGLGHVAYIRACVLLRRRENPQDGNAWWYGSIAMWLLIGGIAWYFAASTGTRHPVMRYPALAYTLLLSTTAGATTGLALSNPKFVPVAIGAILFLVSDLLLANWIFHGIVYRPFDMVWLSYGLGQMLIVYGAAAFIHRTEPRDMY